MTAQKVRLSRKKGKRYLPKLAQREFVSKLQRAEKVTNALKEKQLDKIIAKEHQKRADAYSDSEWYLAEMSLDEMGVWRRAGGLPVQWTCGTLRETARHMRRGLKADSQRIRARSKRAIPRIMEFSNIIAKERRLFPIVFMGGTGTCGRKYCKRIVKGDIDDGCMRSIALALKGYKSLRVYFGKPKNIRKVLQ